MTDIADKLRDVQKALKSVVAVQCPTGSWVKPSRLCAEALAKFPDPDAVGTVIEWVRRRHRRMPGIHGVPQNVRAALAKLEDKPLKNNLIQP